MDNGVGMDQAALDQIQGSCLRGMSRELRMSITWQSIGMKMYMTGYGFYMGEEYGIRVTSTVGVGTMVRLLMPVTERERTDGW